MKKKNRKDKEKLMVRDVNKSPDEVQVADLIDDDGELSGWRLSGLDYPTFRLSLVAKVIDRLAARQMARAGDISMPQWRVLNRLALAPEGMTVRDLSQKAWVDRAEVSRAATALETLGLTGRRENPDDGRAPILFISENGLKTFKPLMEMRRQFHELVTAELTTEECEMFDAVLSKIVSRVLKMSD